MKGRSALALSIMIHAVVFILPWTFIAGGPDEDPLLIHVQLVRGKAPMPPEAPQPAPDLPLYEDETASQAAPPAPAAEDVQAAVREARNIPEEIELPDPGRTRPETAGPEGLTGDDQDGPPAVQKRTDKALDEKESESLLPEATEAVKIGRPPRPEVKGSMKPAFSPKAGPEAAPPGLPGPADDDFLARIRNRILAARSYPVLARRRGWEGKTLVRFRLDSTGRPDGLEVIESSGINLLDKASVRAVEKAAPFPPVNGWIRVPIIFRLASETSE